jgi:hypothetical protein
VIVERTTPATTALNPRMAGSTSSPGYAEEDLVVVVCPVAHGNHRTVANHRHAGRACRQLSEHHNRVQLTLSETAVYDYLFVVPPRRAEKRHQFLGAEQPLEDAWRHQSPAPDGVRG